MNPFKDASEVEPELTASKIRLAICIPTRDRSEHLSACLRRIFESSRQPQEIIVSDDSTSPQSRELTKHIAEKFGATYVIGPRRGVCANRNNAIFAVTDSTHIFLTDDDCLISLDFVEKVVAALSQLPDIELKKTIMLGREVLPSGQLINSYRMTFRAFYTECDAPEIISCRAAIYPTFFFERCGYNENIYFGYEDADLSLQAKRHNFLLREIKDIFVYDNGYQDTILNKKSIHGLKDGDIWIAAAKLHVGLRRYVFYRIMPAHAILFLIYMIFLFIKRSVHYRSLTYIPTVVARSRLSRLSAKPSPARIKI